MKCEWKGDTGESLRLGSQSDEKKWRGELIKCDKEEGAMREDGYLAKADEAR